MSKEKATIPLSKGYKPEKLNFPVYVSIKLDGMPLKITLTKDKIISILSRQGTERISALPRVRELQRAIVGHGEYTFVAEMTHSTDKDFKAVSGHVRRNEENEELIMNIFDFVETGKENETFENRTEGTLNNKFGHKSVLDSDKIKIVKQYRRASIRTLEDIMKFLIKREPNAEGLVIRSHNDPFVPNSRSWGYQKLVIKPTYDLRVIRFYEALETKTKKPKGMVGGMWCEYKGGLEVKVPAGKMKHDERKMYWENFKDVNVSVYNWICEVQYKKDDSYRVPREPVWLHWRPEKMEPSYE